MGPATRLAHTLARSQPRGDISRYARGGGLAHVPCLLAASAPTAPRCSPQSSAGKLQRRCYSSGSGIGGASASWLMTGAIGLGALATIYGLLEYFYKSQTWPEPIRGYLKAGIRARMRGDYETAEAFFRQAIEAALLIPSSVLSPSPLLKLSGLYITLAAMFESQNQHLKAFTALFEAYSQFGPEADRLKPSVELSETSWAARGSEGGRYVLDEQDHVRAIALAQKLGHLAVQFGGMRNPPPIPSLPAIGDGSSAVSGLSTPTRGAGVSKSWDDLAERYLSSALAAMLRLGLAGASNQSAASGGQVVLGRDLDLPRSHSGAGGAGFDGDEADADLGIGRVDKRGVAMTMEALSEIYARKGQFDLANQLLLQTVSILLPVKSAVAPPIQDQCQAALLMTTLSSHLARPRTAESTRIARSWSLKALQTADAALRAAGSGAVPGHSASDLDNDGDGGIKVCMQARSVGSYNLGMLAELEKDTESAVAHFKDAGESARRIGFRQGQKESIDALRRVSG